MKLKHEVHKLHGRVYYLSLSVFFLAVFEILLLFEVLFGSALLGLAGTFMFGLPLYAVAIIILLDLRKEMQKEF